MTLEELVDLLNNAEPTWAQSPVVGISIDDGATYSIKGVEVETHSDTDGSTTVWIKLEVN